MSQALEVRLAGRFAGLTASWLAALGRKTLAAAISTPASLSLLACGDQQMRELNAHWRGRDAVTDVLSFPASSPLRGRPSGGAPRLLGDLVLCVPQARRQAKERRHSLQVELAVLTVHGVLHLLGYDHERGARQAARMQAAEARLLAQLFVSTEAAASLLAR